MKINKTLFFVLITISVSHLQAQTKITENFLLGTWDLTIDIDEQLREVEDEARETESIFESVILSTVSGAISGILDRIDISLEFEKGGDVKIIVDAFGEREIEYTEWSIDNRGRLHIDDSESFSSDYSKVWMRDGNIISLQNDDNDDTAVYLRRIK